MLKEEPNWIAGTIELTSKVRYGLSSRGVPQFRFIPYDKNIKPMAVGCSVKDLFHNVHAIVEPISAEKLLPNELPKASLIQNLGVPNLATEQTLLLTTYAFDSQKDLRKEFMMPPVNLQEETRREFVKEGTTFHIDPKGCKDVDDSFTFTKLSDTSWRVWIHIADVDVWIPQNSSLDFNACRRATSFYTPTGQAIAPMLPRQLSEDLASLKGSAYKPTLSLCFEFEEEKEPTNFEWKLTWSRINYSYTYEDAHTMTIDELGALQRLAYKLGGDPGDSHSWVEEMMILYNTKAGELLKHNFAGILRRHSGENLEKGKALEPILEKHPSLKFLTYESAEFCLPMEENTSHKGLERSAYAYATSPLRRYADLINQRAIKQLISDTLPGIVSKTLVDHLNRRQKQAKAFSRELFFSTVLSVTDPTTAVEGIVLRHCPKGYKVYVSKWKTVVTVKTSEAAPEPGGHVKLIWYCDHGMPNWKDRIVFKKQD